jgi:hypothetical protein
VDNYDLVEYHNQMGETFREGKTHGWTLHHGRIGNDIMEYTADQEIMLKAAGEWLGE